MATRSPHFRLRQWLFGFAIVALIGFGLLLWLRQPPVAGQETATHSAAAKPGEVAAPPAILQTWGQRIAAAGSVQFRDLLREAFETHDPKLRLQLLTELFVAWLNRDPQDFGKYFASLQVHTELNSPLRQLVMTALAEALTKLTPEAASSDHVFAILTQFVAILARTDPDAALRWAREWLLDDALDAARVTIAREFARTQPQRGIEVARQATAALRRMQGYHAVAGIWAETEPDAALAWAAALTAPTERAMVLNSVLLTISQRDPQGAATRLGEFQRQMADEYTQTRKASLATLNLTEADLVNDPETFRELMEAGAIAPPTSPDIELMADAGRVIAARLAEIDPAAAIAWADSLGHDFLRMKSLAGLLQGWARIAPADALAFQRKNYPQSNELLTALFDSWAASSPLDAAQATRSLSDSTSRARALESVVSSWVLREDPGTVATWLDKLPAGETSDAMTATVAAALSAATPEQSWQRALSITNEAQRYRALRAAFSVLVVERPDVARTLLDSSPLSAKHQERLSEMLSAVGASK